MTLMLKSDVIGKEFEVDTYEAGSGKLGIKDDCLYNILVNEMPSELEINHDIVAITATADYCAVRCTITDINGRKVQAFNDVSLGHLEKNDDFVKQHPLTQAVQSAVAAAVKRYLGWPRLLTSDGSDSTTVIAYDESETKKTETETVAENTEVTETSEAQTGAEADVKPEAKNKAQEVAQEIESKELDDYSTEELGAMVITSGTHKDKAIAEVWESQPSWFDFIQKYSSEKYKYAKEYAKRKS